ncbi:MAG: hypothetical protein NC133_00635 [Prevotella sp.]|nr:hypothetical protein [Prevotella sp.]
MKSRRVWSKLLAVALVIAVTVLFVLTVVFENAAFMFIGMQIIMGGALFFSIVALMLMAKRAAQDVKKENEEQTDTVHAYAQEIATVNATAGYDNRMAMADHELKSWLRTLHAAPKGDIVKSVVLLVWLFGTLFGGVAMLSYSHNGENLPLMIAGIAVTACFPLTIIVVAIVVATRQRLSRRIDYNQPPLTATVVSCTVSSQTITGAHTRRIGTTNYRVVVTDSAGKQFVAYTRRAYNAGEQIIVQPSRSRGLVTILDENS